MAQRVFRTIGAAADDMKTVFGEDAADLAAQFLVWALAETERCVSIQRGELDFAKLLLNGAHGVQTPSQAVRRLELAMLSQILRSVLVVYASYLRTAYSVHFYTCLTVLNLIVHEHGSDSVCRPHRSTLLLKRHILTPFAVPAGLKATVRCVLLMHAYAAALQSTHGLTVGPRISKELWPVIEQVGRGKPAACRPVARLCSVRLHIFLESLQHGSIPRLRSALKLCCCLHLTADLVARARDKGIGFQAQVLQRRLRRVGDDVRKSVTNEVDRVAHQVRYTRYLLLRCFEGVQTGLSYSHVLSGKHVHTDNDRAYEAAFTVQ